MTEPYTRSAYPDRKMWLQARKHSLGASDAPCVLGMSRFRSAYSVAADKLTKAVDATEDETAEWGRRHEPAIAQKFAEVMEGESFYVADWGDFTICRSTERPHLSCTPDRSLICKTRGSLIGECSIKCAFYDAAKEWSKAVPLAYQIQAQHTMYVLGIGTVYYAVLLNGCSFRWHLIRRNERWLAKMLPLLDDFWAAIKDGKYPNVDAAESTARALARRYPSPTAGHVALPSELTELGDEYDQILSEARKLENRKSLIQNILREAIGEGTIGVLQDASGFSWAANGKGTRTLRRVKKVRELDNGHST